MDLNKSNIKKILMIIFASIIFAYILFNFGSVAKFTSWLLGFMMPFIIGFAIAFILNVPMKGFEKVLFKNPDSKLYSLKRPVCMVLSIICIVLVLTFAITMVIPEVTTTIDTISRQFPGAMEKIKNWAIDMSKDYPNVVDKIMSININWDKLMDDAIALIKSGGSSIVSSTVSIASSFVGAVIDFVVGIFFAIYILGQKEILKKQTKGVLYAVCKEQTADRIIRICAMADKTFSSFISGQCLEACILGMMFFITMTILHIPFALVVSITIAITALIPVLGSFVGCAIGAFLILVDDPKKVIVFLILFIILQQIEGNLIYPHVVGGSVGLPSIWVLMAVIMGGDIMGIVGMLIFVPLFAVLYVIAEESVVARIKEKGIPWEKYNMGCEVPERKKKKKKIRSAETEDEQDDNNDNIADNGKKD
ncbi:MAG: AI-2E family transporter [Coprococcus sp.]